MYVMSEPPRGGFFHAASPCAVVTGRGARRGQRLACFGAVARAGADRVGHLDLGGDLRRADRDHGGRRRRQHHRPDAGALGQLSRRLRRHPADLPRRRRDRREGRPQEPLVEHEHRGDGLLRPLSRGSAVRPLRRRLALAAGADRRASRCRPPPSPSSTRSWSRPG